MNHSTHKRQVGALTQIRRFIILSEKNHLQKNLSDKEKS